MQEGKINLEEEGVDECQSWGESSHVTYSEVLRKLDDFLGRKEKGGQEDSSSPGGLARGTRVRVTCVQ